MTTRQEREGNSKYQTEVLDAMLAEKANKQCADCGARGPRWASTNLGCFLCIGCSGIHRKLGTHISKVRSVSLDKWSKEQVDVFKELGNKRVNRYYEARLDDDYRRPKSSDDMAMEKFIRDKYEKKRWAAKTSLEKSPRRDRDERDGRDDVEPVASHASVQLAPAAAASAPLFSFEPSVVAAPPQQQPPPHFPPSLFAGQQQQQQNGTLSKDALLSLYAQPMAPQNNQQPQQQAMGAHTGFHGQPNYNVHLSTQAQQQYYQQPAAYYQPQQAQAGYYQHAQQQQQPQQYYPQPQQPFGFPQQQQQQQFYRPM